MFSYWDYTSREWKNFEYLYEINKQLNKGDNYIELNKTITINILDFDYLEDENFHSSYRLYEDITRKILTDVVEIMFIELRKFTKIPKDYNNKLHGWLSFLIDPKESDRDLEELNIII